MAESPDEIEHDSQSDDWMPEGEADLADLELLLDSFRSTGDDDGLTVDAPATTASAPRREPPVARLLRLLRALAATDTRGVAGPDLLTVGGYDVGSPKSAMASLQRDLRRLGDAGWQITNVAPDGSVARYVLRPNDLAARAGLTPGEQSALEEAVAAHGDRITGVDADAVPDAIRSVRHAIEARCVLEMTYNGRLRRVHPMRLHSPPGRWLLRAMDEHDDVVKWFLVHKIEDLSLDDPGSAGADIDDPTDSLNPHHWRVDPPTDVELRVGREHLPLVRRTLDSSPRVRGDADEVTVVVTVTNRRALTDWLVTMGERVVLVGPPDLRGEFLSRLEAVARG